ncbi:hypothetical protein [Bradyrhizobium guangxiense]|uniref:hypothetical protein n=1 Tax=Bradyrhizobium guangxiense TaxID=1325115 RepID=UPI001008ED34|nr:hypothetical protein [Bradyrhizobium guangxiense]
MTMLSNKEIAVVLDSFVPGSSLSLLDALRKILDSARPNQEVLALPPAAALPGGAAPPAGGNGPFPPPRNEPGTEMTTDEIFERLKDLNLPQPILEQATPVFARAKYVVSSPKAKAKSDSKIARPFTLAEREDGVRLALINVPRQVFQKSIIWGSLADGIEEIDAYVRFVSSDNANKVTPGFDYLLSSAGQRGKKWDFIPWDWVNDFLCGNETAERVFRLPDLGRSPSMLTLNDLKQTDRKLIKAWLSDRAGQPGTVKPGQRLRDLVDQADWSKEASKKVAGFGDDPDTLAFQVCELAIDQDRFQPTSHPRYGDTYLGAVLLALLPEAGSADRKQIAELIERYNLISRPDSIGQLKKSIGV